MFEITILIPVCDNDGNAFGKDSYEAFEKEACSLFGGFTKFGKAKGGWVDKGKVYEDETIIYKLAIASIADGSKVLAVTETAGAIFQQKGIYISFLGMSEVIDTSHMIKETVISLVAELLLD